MSKQPPDMMAIAFQEKIKYLEERVKRMMNDKEELDKQDMEYDAKIQKIESKRLQYLQDIHQLRAEQETKLKQTNEIFSEMRTYAEQFQELQIQFVQQQKRDRDTIKSYQIIKHAKQHQGGQFLSVQNPFVLLSQAQGLLDSQADQSEIPQFPFGKSVVVLTLIKLEPEIPTLDQFAQMQLEGLKKGVPLKMYFLIDFYDFPTFKSKNVVFIDCPTVIELRDGIYNLYLALATEKELKFVYEDYVNNQDPGQKPVFCFEVPITYHYLRYMHYKNIQIRLVDAQTGDRYGYCQIPLAGLINEKQHNFKYLESQLMSFDWKVTHGVVACSIQNLGLQNESLILAQTATQSKFFTQTLKSKVVSKSTLSTKPFSKDSMIGTQKINISKGERIKVRINILKKISNISEIKTMNTTGIISNILHSVQPQSTLEVRIGEKQIQEVQFEVPEDGSYFTLCEGAYVAQGVEMEILCEQHNVKAFRQTMNKGELVSLFIVVYHLEQQRTQISLQIINQYDTPVAGSLYQIEYLAPVIDLNFDYFLPADSQESIKLPQLFCFAKKTFLLTLMTDNLKVALTIGDNVHLSLKTEHAGQYTIAKIYFYHDQLMLEHLLTVQVNILAVSHKQMAVELGQKFIETLTLEISGSRLLYLHSSQPTKLKPLSPYDEPFYGNSVDIPLEIYLTNEKTQRVQVNLVDLNTSEVVHMKIFTFKPSPPIIRYSYTIETDYTQIRKIELKYKNPKDYPLTINLETSSYLLKAINTKYDLKPRETITIELCIQIAQEYVNQGIELIEQKREAKLYLFNNEFFECHLFIIQFV